MSAGGRSLTLSTRGQEIRRSASRSARGGSPGWADFPAARSRRGESRSFRRPDGVGSKVDRRREGLDSPRVRASRRGQRLVAGSHESGSRTSREPCERVSRRSGRSTGAVRFRIIDRVVEVVDDSLREPPDGLALPRLEPEFRDHEKIETGKAAPRSRIRMPSRRRGNVSISHEKPSASRAGMFAASRCRNEGASGSWTQKRILARLTQSPKEGKDVPAVSGDALRRKFPSDRLDRHSGIGLPDEAARGEDEPREILGVQSIGRRGIGRIEKDQVERAARPPKMAARWAGASTTSSAIASRRRSLRAPRVPVHRDRERRSPRKASIAIAPDPAYSSRTDLPATTAR